MEASVIPLVVAATATWTPSRRLQSAALAEHERVERKLDELDQRHAALEKRLGEVTAARDELREQLAMLNRLIHGADDEILASEAETEDPAAMQPRRRGRPAVEPFKAVDAPGATALRGQAIREAAARALAASPRAGEPVHYKDWFELLRADGVVPAGKDPLATFLTQLGRSPVITRTSGKGVYMLDHEFPARARKKLEQLRRELRDAHDAPVNSEFANAASVRIRRIELATDVNRLERELEEALRSLTPVERPLGTGGQIG